jgi:hypothetical protein
VSKTGSSNKGCRPVLYRRHMLRIVVCIVSDINSYLSRISSFQAITFLQLAACIINAMQCVSFTEVADDLWPYDNGSLLTYSYLPLKQYNQHERPVSADWLPNQSDHVRDYHVKATKDKIAGIKGSQKKGVSGDNEGSIEVVRENMHKCDHANCHKAFRRIEHLNRHRKS